MIKTANSRKLLAAIDLDGTLFGPSGRVHPANYAALERLAARGFVVVLASGRHPADIVKIARNLPMVAWIVGGQGCEVTDVARERVLSRTYLAAGEAALIAEAGHAAGYGVFAYTTDDEIAAWRNDDELARYEGLSQTNVRFVEPNVLEAETLFKMMWVGATERIDALVTSGGHPVPGVTAATVRSHDFVFEFVPPDASKGTGLATLAGELGLAREHVVCFGDADNDLSMFDWAGCAVAMPHARDHVKARASFVASAGPSDDAFARGVAELLEGERGGAYV